MTKKTHTLVPSDFVHLHNHTHHSLLDGMTKIEPLVERIKMLEMEAVAITDHGTLSGVIDFYKACKNEDIKPIIGMEAYVAARKHTDKEVGLDKNRYHLTMLAMNNKGYENLMRLSTIANLEGYYYKPRIDHNLLEKYNEGLIILSGCPSSEVGEALRAGDYRTALKTAKWYHSVFGDRYYLEIGDHTEWDEQLTINKGVMKISKEIGVPVVLTGDAHYLDRDDAEAHDILLCVGTGSYRSDTDRMTLKDFELHVKDPKEIIKKWQDTPEVITTTKTLADRCNVEIKLGEILIPRFVTPRGETEKSYLDRLVHTGLAWRYGGLTRDKAMRLNVTQAKKKISKEILERAAYELDVISSMNFNGYFLIVQDFINWGKDRGIIFGPGRGSAAGSIVSYSLNITDLEPLTYDLLFERFLNPDRISMPDIDIDIQDTRREEVINYCVDKYGKDRVANILTFGTMAARAAVRDVARVLEVPYGEADYLAKLVPAPVQGRHIPIKTSAENDSDLKKEYQENERSREVIDFASKLEGTIRSHGVHAAGVVIAPDELVKFAPLEMSQKGVVSTQYSMWPIEDLGLLKIDFLGLSNLTIINNAMRIIKKVYKNEIILADLLLDDKKTFELFQQGNTTGIFQFESAGMKRYLKQLKPTVFDDLVAMSALYRPGPMQFIDSFIRRKHGKEKVTYAHPKVEEALKETYGVIVYQEQVMQISKTLAGFTGGEADTLRKAMGKKIKALMEKMRERFLQGVVENGESKELAVKMFDNFETFSQYGFVKAHAACYATIAYWTAYLKAHYPDAFMAALMTSDQDNIDRLSIEIAECQHMGIEVLPPDVNESFMEFAIVPNKKQIRFALPAVKGVGSGAVEEILQAKKDTKFKNLGDFARRVSSSKVNRKAWESLIKAGAFDSMGDRSDILFNLDSLLGLASKINKEHLSGQTDLFGGLSDDAVASSLELKSAPTKHTEKERLSWERDLLGLYLSAHPLDKYSDYLREQTLPLNEISAEHDGKEVIVGGVIASLRAITTKSGSKMAFLKLEDKFAEIELVVFPKQYEKLSDQLIQDTVIRVRGTIQARDRAGNLQDDIKITVEDITPVTYEELDGYKSNGVPYVPPATKNKKKAPPKPKQKSVLAAKPTPDFTAPVAQKLYIHVKDTKDHEKLLTMKQLLNKYPGDNEAILVLGEDKASAIRLPFKLQISQELMKNLSKIYGKDCVVVK